MAKRSLLPFLAISAAGGVFALASRCPETLTGAALTVLVALMYAAQLPRSLYPARDLFCSGMIFHLVAFTWLPDTLDAFGGFGPVIGWLLFIVYCAVSSIQFACCGWLYRYAMERQLLQRCSLCLATAWFLSEYLIPRLFPWMLCHPLITIRPFAALATYFGTAPLGFLLLWISSLLVDVCEAILNHRSYLARLSGLAVMNVAIVVLGQLTVREISDEMAVAPSLAAGLIQGNLEVHEKRDERLLGPNLERYQRLSEDALRQGAEVLFWPETVSTQWMSERVASVVGTKLDVYPEAPVPLLYGGLAYRERGTPELKSLLESYGGDFVKAHLDDYQYEHFNAVFGRDLTGRITGRYYKRVLMPFGEYLPFAHTFPQLRELSPESGIFDSGDLTKPILVEVQSGDQRKRMSVGVLICYEDLIPRLSTEAVRDGANILVNFTNDAWYGDTAAPRQHHLLAMWRAIESRRYLLRVTNTGYTGIVNPLGETEIGLPTFARGVAVKPVKLLDAISPYVRIGDLASWALVILLGLALLVAPTEPITVTD